MQEAEVLILGAGVTGLAAAVELQHHALIIEKESRPGGLVQTYCFDGGYWYDKVLHLLHFNDPEIQHKIMSLDDIFLKSCPPDAWIECGAGTVRYPFQLNLGGLSEQSRISCLHDYAAVYFGSSAGSGPQILNYREYLKAAFGDAMCEYFFYPYNEKLWKFPLEEISSTENSWNILRPDFKEVLRGSFQPGKDYKTYNSNAFYPQPPANSKLRGMEILSQALARNTHQLELDTRVLSIDTNSQSVHVVQNQQQKEFRYRAHCLSTLPLPVLMSICSDVPATLQKDVALLRYNKVISVALSIEGPRPKDKGHWCYYTDPSVPFTRLIYSTAFDPLMAPANGWPLLVEITWPGDKTLPSRESLFAEIEAALLKLDLLNNGCIIGRHMWIADPAYVIFTFDNQRVVNDCKDFLGKKGIRTLGRYGNWEYSSMFQNMREGFAAGRDILNLKADVY